MKRIAVIMPKWIGDYVMSLSVVEEYRRRSNDHVALITAPYLVELAESLTDMEIIPYRTVEGLHSARTGNYSDLYIIPHSISSGMWGFSTGIKKRHGYKKEGRSPLLTKRHTITNKERIRHITTEYTTLFDIPELDLDAVPGASLTVEPSNAIVLCPGAKYGPAKQWPHFSHLIEALPEQKFIIMGGKDEFKYGELLKKENPERDVTNLCGKDSLHEAARGLAASKVVISNDSGLMHLAAYAGAYTIGIFGSSTPAWTRPVGKNATVIWHNEECSPCFKRECPYKHYHCLDKITVDEVISHMKPFL